MSEDVYGEDIEPVDEYTIWQREQLNEMSKQANRGLSGEEKDKRTMHGPVQNRYTVEQKKTLGYYPKDRKDKRPVQGPIMYVPYENPMYGKDEKVEYAGRYKKRLTPVQLQKIEFTFGSQKLDKTIATFNPGGSAHECPSMKKGYCPIADECYAMHGFEKQYYKASPAMSARMKYQFRYIPTERYVEDLNRFAEKNIPVRYSRFSVAGDIEHQWEVDKLARIGAGIEKAGIGLYGYSKARGLDWGVLPSNVRLNVGGGKPPKGHSVFKMLPEDRFESYVRKLLKESGGHKPKGIEFCIAGIHSCGPTDRGGCHKCMPDHPPVTILGYARRRGKEHKYYGGYEFSKWNRLMKSMRIPKSRWSKW